MQGAGGGGGTARVVVLSGSPVAGSRTWSYANAVAGHLDAQGFDVRLIDLRVLPPAGLLYGPGDAGPVRAALDAVSQARGVVVATPVHHAAYSGILKAFLDLLPRSALAGKVALPLAVGGSPVHTLAIDYALRPVLVSLGAAHVTRGHFLLGAEVERAGDGALRLQPEAEQRLVDVLREFEFGLRLHARGEAGAAPPPPSAAGRAPDGAGPAAAPIHGRENAHGTSSHHEYLVVGAGPAGVQLGYYFERRGRDYLVLERGLRPGAFFETYPRHRKLISTNRVYTGSADPEFNLRHDRNSLLSDGHDPLFREFSREFFPPVESLLAYLQSFVERHGIRVRYDSPVLRISREGERFLVESARGDRFSCSYLVVATGVSRPYVPDIQGIELAEGYEDVSVDPADFTDQRVLVIGKGGSGLETAANLAGTAALLHLVSPGPADMAWKSHCAGGLRAVEDNLLDRNALIDAEVRSIEERRDGRLTVALACRHARGGVEERVYDRVIRCTGFRFDASIFDASCMPEPTLPDRLPRLTCEWESVNQPNLYFAGALMQGARDRKSTSGSIHGFRYNVRLLDRILGEKNHREPWPADAIPLEPGMLCSRVLDRVNTGSDLWQQQGFLGDLLVVGSEGAAEHRSGLPVGYIHEKYVARGRHCFVTTLETGCGGGVDPCTGVRTLRDDAARAGDGDFLHPAIREYRDGIMVSEHHVVWELEARWEEEEHGVPLRGYFEQRLRDAPAASTTRIPGLRIADGEAHAPAPGGPGR